ncbi:hypothetical protein [Pyrococcus kukulkanii]|uniref:hypothetical protein n=1 Tax=Pyrococcus kukulkanii TaxID=1609559 RepID=UPI0035667286
MSLELSIPGIGIKLGYTNGRIATLIHVIDYGNPEKLEKNVEESKTKLKEFYQKVKHLHKGRDSC